MRRPNIFGRSGEHPHQKAFRESDERAAAKARAIADVLRELPAEAEAEGLKMLAYLLGCAKDEADRLVAEADRPKRGDL